LSTLTNGPATFITNFFMTVSDEYCIIYDNNFAAYSLTFCLFTNVKPC
jgi:hypothetical protein